MSDNGDGKDQATDTQLSIPDSIITRIQQRDETAFRELLQIVYTPLTIFANSISKSHDDAKDIVQDVFMQIWNLGPRWNPAGDPVAYLFASVRNSALKELRRRHRETQRAIHVSELERTESGEPVEQAPHTLDHLIQTETGDIIVQQVSRALATLSERYRTVYELRYRQGLTTRAIAQVLGVSTKSAEHLVARVTRIVLQRLREAAEAEETDK